MAATPKRVDSTRSNAVGVPPRCTWPSITTRVSNPVRSPISRAMTSAIPPRRTWPNWSYDLLLDVERAGDRLGALGDDDDRRVAVALVAAAEALAHLVDVERDLRDQHHRRPAGDAGVGGDPAAVAAHHLDDHHPVVALGRRVQAVDGVGGDLHGGVEAERHVGADDVVVDRLGHADDRHAVLRRTACRRRVSEPLPPITMSASRPRSANVAATSSTPVGRVERAAPLGAEHGAAPRQRAAHRLDRQRHRPPLAHAVPGVEEADELVAVDALALAHDGADDGVQAGAVAATGEHADAHGAERTSAAARPAACYQSPAWDGMPAGRCRGGGSSRSGLIYAGIMAVVFAAALPRRRRPRGRSLGGLLVSGPLYLGLGFVLAKFGYQRKTLAELRTPPRRRPVRRPSTDTATRATPAPTRRTSTGRNRPAAKRGGADHDTRLVVRRRHRRRHDRDPQPGRLRRRRGPAVASYREFTQHFPRPGWVEHDAAEIWEAVRATLNDVVEQVGGDDGRGDRDHQPARDGRGVGPLDRRAVRPGDRLAGPAHRRPLRRARGRAAPSTSCAGAPGSCSTRTSAAPSSSGCSREGGVPAPPTSPSARSTRG